MNLISKLLVITLSTLLGSSFSNAQAVKNVWEGAYTEAQAVNGEMLYQEHCSACHGSQMQGIEEAPTLKQGAFRFLNSLPLSFHHFQWKVWLF